MSNKDLPNGFTPVFDENYYAPHRWGATASQTIAIGDVVYITSAGRVSIAVENSTASCFLGVAASAVTSATADDPIYVWDNPFQTFEGQCSGSGALTDPYTTNSADAAFDLDGTTGIMEIDENASSQNVFKVVGVGKDPVTGLDSAVGANQRLRVRFNLAIHAFGTTA